MSHDALPMLTEQKITVYDIQCYRNVSEHFRDNIKKERFLKYWPRKTDTVLKQYAAKA